MAMYAPGSVGCARRCEVVTRFGGVSEAGMERSRVVEVPRERTASPGAANEITVAGLSPVKGATLQPGYVDMLIIFGD